MGTGFHDSPSRLQWICLFLDCTCNCQSHRSAQVYIYFLPKCSCRNLSFMFRVIYSVLLFSHMRCYLPLSCSFSQTFSKIVTFLLLFPSIFIFLQFFPSIVSLRLPFLSWRTRWKKKWGRIIAWDNRNCAWCTLVFVSVCVCTRVSHVIAPFFLESHSCTHEISWDLSHRKLWENIMWSECISLTKHIMTSFAMPSNIKLGQPSRRTQAKAEQIFTLCKWCVSLRPPALI